YEEHQQTPPHPLYPFDETKLRELGKSRPTVRSVLKWCAENFVPNEPIIDDLTNSTTNTTSATNATSAWTSTTIHPFKACFDNELANVEASINSLMEDEVTIADALWLTFNTLIGQTVEGVTIK
ncbi:MAG: hypothetical protein ACYT04_80560, partial [Nostoc sp.]